MTQGNKRISERGSKKDLVFIVYQKPEASSQSNE